MRAPKRGRKEGETAAKPQACGGVALEEYLQLPLDAVAPRPLPREQQLGNTKIINAFERYTVEI